MPHRPVTRRIDAAARERDVRIEREQRVVHVVGPEVIVAEAVRKPRRTRRGSATLPSGSEWHAGTRCLLFNGVLDAEP